MWGGGGGSVEGRAILKVFVYQTSIFCTLNVIKKIIVGVQE